MGLKPNSTKVMCNHMELCVKISFLKVRQIRNDFLKLTFLPKNERMNSFLLLCDLFSFVFWKKLTIPKRHFEINWPLGAQNKLLVISFSNIVIFMLKFKTIKPCSIKKIIFTASYLLTHPGFYIFLLLLKVWIIDKLCTYHVSFDKVTVVINVVNQWCKTIIYSRARQPMSLWFCSSWKNTLFVE